MPFFSVSVASRYEAIHGWLSSSLDIHLGTGPRPEVLEVMISRVSIDHFVSDLNGAMRGEARTKCGVRVSAMIMYQMASQGTAFVFSPHE